MHEHVAPEPAFGEVWFLLWYLLDGAGFWATRWHCTGGDVTLFIYTVVACAWMALEYAIYAVQTWHATGLSKSVEDRIHKRWLALVFFNCGILHVANALISWVWTPYYLIATGYLTNAICTRLLNRSQWVLKSQQEAEMCRQSHESLTLMRRTYAAAADKESTETLLELARQLKGLSGNVSTSTSS